MVISHSSSTRHIARIVTVMLMVLLFPSALCRAAEVTATLDRPSVEAGNGAILSVKISGGAPERIGIPEVAGLVIQQHGQNQQMQMGNGGISRSVTYNYVVGSHQAGEYEIPAISVTVNGEQFTTQPLKLKVTAAEAEPEPPAEDTAGTGKFGFLTVELAGVTRKHAYVGEIAPVIIRAWLPADSRAQLRSGIQPEGSGFTLHNVSERPQQQQEMRDGKRYLVVTWYGGISATKAGKFPAALSVDATIAIRDNSAPKRRRGGPFDDPFFGGIFEDLNQPMIQKDVTLKSEDQEIEVRPLPEEGRPADFTGAVGDFKFDGVRIPSMWTTGEPNQITAKVTGSGNFALLNAPAPIPGDAWKIYPGKDDFKAGDQASFSGSKDFQFSAVPKKGGAQNVSLQFSYFDPAKEAYQTLVRPIQPIQVSGKDLVEIEPAVVPPSTEKPVKKTGGLIAQHERRGPSGSLVPLVSRPAFVPILGVSMVLCALGKILALLRVRRTDPRRRAQAAMESATREALDAAQKCAAQQDVLGYFAAARLAIQQQLGGLWNQPPQAITLAEVTSRLPDDSPVAQFFREADRCEYNRPAKAEILPQWRSLLDAALASLTPNVSAK